MAMNGAASINQVSDIFSDLSQNAQKAAIEVARLAAVTAKGLDLSGAAEQIGDLFKDLLQPVAPKVEKLATVAEKVGAALTDLASGSLARMNKATGALANAMGEVAKSGGGSSLGKIGQQFQIAAAGMVAGTVGVTRGLLGFAGTVGQIGGAIVGGFQAAINGAIGLGKALLNIPGWFQAAIGPIQRMFGSISPFVGALNPAYLLRFQSAMLDLQAVIGRAMVPFADGLTRLTRAFADMMVPVSQKLKPVFEVLGQIVQQVGTNIMAIFGAALIQIGPSLKKFASSIGGALEGFVAAVAAITPTLLQGFTSLTEWLAQRVIPALGSFVESLVNGTNKLANSTAWLVDAFQHLMIGIELQVIGWKGIFATLAKAINWITEKIPFVGGKTFSQESIDQWDKSIEASKDRMFGQDPATLQREKDAARFQAGLLGMAGALGKQAGNNASLGAANRGSGYSSVEGLGRSLAEQSFGQTPIEERQLGVLEQIAQGIGQMAAGFMQPKAGAVGGPGVNANPGFLANLFGQGNGGPAIPGNKFNRIDGDPNGI